jgi:isoaspartyl peptidase/L-asparaginase-like protein (Ntn-hydrolase superfamily)
MKTSSFDRRRLLAVGGMAALSSAFPSVPTAAGEPAGPVAKRPRFAIAIHGGAGKSPEKMTPEQIKAVEASLEKALAIGVETLETGGTSLDAVEKVIRFLEDDPHFNAGKGAVFNSAGGHELDASIMDGKTKACGGVAAVRTVKNPISLARLVMTKTRHVLLASDGAEKFADEMQVERVENAGSTPTRPAATGKSGRRQMRRSNRASPIRSPHSPLTTHHSLPPTTEPSAAWRLIRTATWRRELRRAA